MPEMINQPVNTAASTALNSDGNSETKETCGACYIPSYETNLSDIKPLMIRSVMQQEEICANELIYLILTGGYSNDVHYKVKGDLSLAGYTDVQTLPEHLYIEGSLFLNDCVNIEALPSNLHVKNDLYLSGCIKLRDLPGSIRVEGDLDLTGTGLITLRKNFAIDGILWLCNCADLTELPDNLYVGNSLIISHCPGLVELGDKLTVLGDLDLTGCINLRALPESLSLGGNLCLSGCRSLRSLPDWITTLGPIPDRGMRQVFLDNTGLSDTLIDQLRTVEAPGMQFIFSRQAEQLEQPFDTLGQAFAFWQNLACSSTATLELSLRHDQTDDLVVFLGRLKETADYKNQGSRLLLAQRVMEIMEFLNRNEPVRDRALDCIHEAISSCEDRIILAIDDLETLQMRISAETRAIENNDPADLRALGQQMMILDKVREIARDHMRKLRWVDEIEVELAYRIEVSKYFPMPGSTQNMVFRSSAGVSDDDIASACTAIQSACSEAQLESYLNQWAPWQKYQRHLATPPFDQLRQYGVEHIAPCTICGEKTVKMVMVGNHPMDYDTLCRTYLENGKNPLTNTPLEWSAVVRLTEQSNTNATILNMNCAAILINRSKSLSEH